MIPAGPCFSAVDPPGFIADSSLVGYDGGQNVREEAYYVKQKLDDFEAHYSCLERLEDDRRHADLGIEERCELEDRVLRLRQRLSR
jgi:hypothetical protein